MIREQRPTRWMYVSTSAAAAAADPWPTGGPAGGPAAGGPFFPLAAPPAPWCEIDGKS